VSLKAESPSFGIVPTGTATDSGDKLVAALSAAATSAAASTTADQKAAGGASDTDRITYELYCNAGASCSEGSNLVALERRLARLEQAVAEPNTSPSVCHDAHSNSSKKPW
jgi:hypothetical protein